MYIKTRPYSYLGNKKIVWSFLASFHNANNGCLNSVKWLRVQRTEDVCNLRENECVKFYLFICSFIYLFNFIVKCRNIETRVEVWENEKFTRNLNYMDVLIFLIFYDKGYSCLRSSSTLQRVSFLSGSPSPFAATEK